MTKVFNLDYMINGFDGYGKPCQSIPSQMKDILEANPKYKFQNLIYHPTKVINMQYATLIIEIQK